MSEKSSVDSKAVFKRRDRESAFSNKRMLSVRETAEYCGLAVKTLRNRLGPNAVNPFPVRCKRIGGCRKPLFDRRDLDEYLDSLENVS